MDHSNANRPQPISIWLESLVSSRTSATGTDAEPSVIGAKDEAILALLAKLSLHYWRPDFTPGQAKQMYGDYLEDLRPYALSDINDAIKKYRQSGERFFPTSGQLCTILRTPYSWESTKDATLRLRESAEKELQKITLQLGQSKPVRAIARHSSEIG